LKVFLKNVVFSGMYLETVEKICFVLNGSWNALSFAFSKPVLYSSILGSQQEYFPDIGLKIRSSPPIMVVARLFLTPAKIQPPLKTTASASWAFAGLHCGCQEMASVVAAWSTARLHPHRL
jgi:hypothetical protein